MNKTQNLSSYSRPWLALLCAALPCWHAAYAAPVPCSNLAIDPTTVPLAVYPKVQLNAGDSLLIPAAGNPVVDIRIAPPVTLNPLNSYQCDVDYMADLTAGDATLTFNRNAPYFVRITRANGDEESTIIEVGVRSHGKGTCEGGAATEIPCGTPKIVLVSSTLGFPHSWGSAGVIVTGIDDARAAIAAAYEANDNTPIDVSIDAHGSPGNIELGNDRIDGDNAAAFAASIDGMVSNLTVFACSVADGAEGEALMCTLEQELGADSMGYTGENWDNPPDEAQAWWTAGECYSWEACSPDDAIIEIDDAINDVDGGDLSVEGADGQLEVADGNLANADSFTAQSISQYQQASELADACGNCAGPAQDLIAGIVETLSSSQQQVQEARMQIQDARNQIQQARLQMAQAKAKMAAARNQLQQSPPDTSSASQNLQSAKEDLDRARQKLDRARGELNRAQAKLDRAHQKYVEVQSLTASAANMLIACGPCSQPALQTLQLASQSNNAADNNVTAAIPNVDAANTGATQAVSYLQLADASASQAILLLANCATCPLDINGDGIVNVIDLLHVISAWGACPGCPADTNGDGVVNVIDLLAIIGGWGACL